MRLFVRTSRVNLQRLPPSELRHQNALYPFFVKHWCDVFKSRDKKGDVIVGHFDGEGKDVNVNAVALREVVRPFLIPARCDEYPFVRPLQIFQHGTETAELSSTDWLIPMFCFYCALARLCARHELPIDVDLVRSTALSVQYLVRLNSNGLHRILAAHLVQQLRDDRQMRFTPVCHASARWHS